METDGTFPEHSWIWQYSKNKSASCGLFYIVLRFNVLCCSTRKPLYSFPLLCCLFGQEVKHKTNQTFAQACEYNHTVTVISNAIFGNHYKPLL